MSLWELPEQAQIGGKTYRIHGDFRDILEIFGYLNDPDLPEMFRWRVALALIYREILQTPVTIAPGESATIRMAIEHGYPGL